MLKHVFLTILHNSLLRRYYELFPIFNPIDHNPEENRGTFMIFRGHFPWICCLFFQNCDIIQGYFRGSFPWNSIIVHGIFPYIFYDFS